MSVIVLYSQTISLDDGGVVGFSDRGGWWGSVPGSFRRHWPAPSRRWGDPESHITCTADTWRRRGIWGSSICALGRLLKLSSSYSPRHCSCHSLLLLLLLLSFNYLNSPWGRGGFSKIGFWFSFALEIYQDFCFPMRVPLYIMPRLLLHDLWGKDWKGNYVKLSATGGFLSLVPRVAGLCSSILPDMQYHVPILHTIAIVIVLSVTADGSTILGIPPTRTQTRTIPIYN